MNACGNWGATSRSPPLRKEQPSLLRFLCQTQSPAISSALFASCPWHGQADFDEKSVFSPVLVPANRAENTYQAQQNSRFDAPKELSLPPIVYKSLILEYLHGV